MLVSTAGAATTDQRNQARIAGQDRNQLASVNKGKPPVTASDKPFNDNNKPKDFAPVTAADKKTAQNQMKANNNNNKAGGSQNNQTQSQHKNQQGNQGNKNQQGNQGHNNQMQGNPPKHNQTQGNPPKNNQNSGNPPKHNSSVQMNPMGSHPQSYNQHPHRAPMRIRPTRRPPAKRQAIRPAAAVIRRAAAAIRPSGGGHPPSGSSHPYSGRKQTRRRRRRRQQATSVLTEQKRDPISGPFSFYRRTGSPDPSSGTPSIKRVTSS